MPALRGWLLQFLWISKEDPQQRSHDIERKVCRKTHYNERVEVLCVYGGHLHVGR